MTSPGRWLFRRESDDQLIGFGSLGQTRRRWPPPTGPHINLLIIPQLAVPNGRNPFTGLAFGRLDTLHCRSSLEAAIQALPGIDQLRHPPRVYNYEFGAELVKQFEQKSLVPVP